MEKLTLVFTSVMPDDIKNYLSSLDGVNKFSMNTSEEYGVIFEFEYDKNTIKCQNILQQIGLYFKDPWKYDLIGFDKHYNNVKEVTYDKPNLCCEYCYMNLVDTLFNNDDVSSFKHITDDIYKYGYKDYKTFLIKYLKDKSFIDDAVKRYSID